MSDRSLAHIVAIVAASLAIGTGGALAETLSMKCEFEAANGQQPLEVLYVTNTAVYGKTTVIGAFGTHEATSFMDDNTMFILENTPEASATSMIYVKPNEQIIAIRSTMLVLSKTEVPANQSNVMTGSLRGTCAMQR